MNSYLKGRFIRHLHQKVPHLHFKITSVMQSEVGTEIQHLKNLYFVVQPNKLRLKEYDLLDTEGYLGRKDVVVGKITKSKHFSGWWNLILYKERLP